MSDAIDTGIDPIDRVDGRQKVTGAAKYAAEYKPAGMQYGVLVGSTIARGSITAIDAKAATNAPGVTAVITHLNCMPIPGYQSSTGDVGTTGLKIFSSDKIYFDGQPIALVIADTFERALFAASLVKTAYKKEDSVTDLDKHLDKAASPKRGEGTYQRGQAGAFLTAPVFIDEEYVLAQEVHNPMELGSVIAHWEAADQLIVYDKTQGVKASQRTYAKLFGISPENVRVVSPFVGGAFGMALRTWPYEVAAVAGARQTGKPLKLMLSRAQMFTMVGYRPYTIQRIGIGATADGKFIGITHNATGVTASYEEFTEGVTGISQILYACPNVDTTYKIAPLDVSVPTWMRGPGETTGAFALESAIDELAYKLNIDPLELRIRNYAEVDPQRNLPFSSKYLKECYQLGAEKIGWFNRDRKPASMKEDGMLIGYGMSGGVFGAYRSNASARAVLKADGSLLVQSAASDIGPGTGTAMTKIAMNVLGLPAAAVKIELGDSNLPPAPTQGGSGTTSAVGSAVYDVCAAVKEKLIALAASAAQASTEESEKFTLDNGNINTGSASYSITDLMKQNDLADIDLTRDSKGGAERQKYAFYSFSVHFTKVQVHPTTGVVRVKQVVSVADAGTIISEKTARSQMIGGVVGGIGMALTEEAIFDHRFGRYVNNNLADYHVAVNADVPDIDVLFVNKPDPYINPIGAKGMGEIALIGYAASVTNAIYHATGKRIRRLPATLDKILMAKT